jgi:hypothetical protein
LEVVFLVGALGSKAGINRVRLTGLSLGAPILMLIPLVGRQLRQSMRSRKCDYRIASMVARDESS